MKNVIIVFLVLFSTLIQAQDKITVTFSGDRADVCLYDRTASYAIGEMVDAVCLKDFVPSESNPEYTYYHVWAQEQDGGWYFVRVGTMYNLGLTDGPAPGEDEDSQYSNLNDAKARMKIIMRAYFNKYGSLDPSLWDGRWAM